MDVDVAVLGGGPGGYPAAIRAAQLGLSVAVIEQGNLGGTCLNVGCIPTKAWVQSAHAMKDATETFAHLGVAVSRAALDFDQVQKNKDTIVKARVAGVGGLYDELLGVVVVGINATEIVNAGVIALDAEATIETVADSIAAHPTLAEGLKEAGLVALGRPIHLPPMKKRS